MTELSVTLSDYLLALICIVFAWHFYKNKRKQNLLGRLWTILFASLASASLAGGTVHGFYSDETTLTYQILWLVTLLSLGITAASCWILSGFFLNGRQHISKWIFFASLLFVIYAVAVIFLTQNFLFAILNYLSALICLLVVVIRCYLKTKISYFLWIILGIILTFLAAGLQRSGISIHPYFNHNTVYHLVQALGFTVVFIGAKGLVELDRNSYPY